MIFKKLIPLKYAYYGFCQFQGAFQGERQWRYPVMPLDAFDCEDRIPPGRSILYWLYSLPVLLLICHKPLQMKAGLTGTGIRHLLIRHKNLCYAPGKYNVPGELLQADNPASAFRKRISFKSIGGLAIENSVRTILSPNVKSGSFFFNNSIT